MAVLFLLLAVACSALDLHQTLNDEYDPTHVELEKKRAGIPACLRDAGPCSDLGASFRKNYPAIIIEACARCTATQKTSLCLFMKRAMKDLPAEFQKLSSKYDPQDLYFDKFFDAIKRC